MQPEVQAGASGRRDIVIRISLGVASGLGMALAALLMIAPYAGPPPAFPFQDKVFHVLVFACLTGPGVLVLPKKYLWFWLAHMIALGAGIEVVQPMGDAGRAASIWDFLADLAGIVLALGVGRAIRTRMETG
jgi:hypothetical protein